MSSVRLDVHTREPFADGRRFADGGAYEVLTATAHYAVDPEAAAHRSIADLELAPRDGDGAVRFSGDVEILRPVDGGRRRRRSALILRSGRSRGESRASSEAKPAPSRMSILGVMHPPSAALLHAFSA
jgi:hypothetical protein